MKSERRHELQHNALLDWLLQTGEKSKPYANMLLLGVLLVVLAVLGYRWMSTSSASKEATAWDSVFQAIGEDDTVQLDQAATDHPGTDAGQWAAVVAGDLQLAAGCQELFRTKATAAEKFTEAQESYKRALEDSSKSAIRERATFGLARTYEAMAGARPSQEDLTRAQEEYQKIVDNWPDGPYAKEAQARLHALGQSSTKEFYDALAKWEPRPAITSPEGLDNLNIPFDGSGSGLDVGGEPKSFFNDTTKRIDDAMGGATEGEAAEGEKTETPATEAPKTESPTTESPQPLTIPPADEKPSEDKPGENSKEGPK